MDYRCVGFKAKTPATGMRRAVTAAFDGQH